VSSREDRAGDRARRIIERLGGSGESLNESAGSIDAARVADRLHQIEQLFLLHGGERNGETGPDPDEVLFEWGHLQVLEKLGQGSFGEVFRAYDRTLDRNVALKLLKTDHDRPFQSRLFLHEARQLALVRHRNVLAVHGAAVHDGRPGLWTDLIDGETAHDDRYRASFDRLEAVLDLVESLAGALQAVHSAGLVHGDVKPSNIMRDASGTWILMDFGASLDQRGAHGGSHLTSGTPLYMAPEVVLDHAPSSRSDLYAMGATLYHVLTGKLPLPAEHWSELAEKHRAGERPLPAASTGTLDRRIAGLIDRLMAREPDQRPTLHEVLNEVQAIRETPQRRFRIIALGSIAGALFIGLTLTSIGFYRANEARQVAEREQRKTFAVNEFLQHVLFSPASSGRGRDLTVEDMLREAALNVERILADQPEARIIVRRVLASSYNTLHLTDLGQDQIRIARAELQEEGLRLPSIERKLALVEILIAMNEQRYEDAISLAEQFLARQSDELGDDHVDVRFARTYQLDSYNALGRLADAEALLDEHFSEVPVPETAENNAGFNILRNRTNLYRAQGRFEEALQAAEEAVDWLERFPRAAQNDRNDALTNLAISLVRVNEMNRAVEVFAALAPLQARIYGPGTNEHIAALSNLAAIQNDLGRPEDARSTLQEALDAIEAHPGLLSEQQRLILMINLANALNATGEQARGEAILRQTLEGSIDLNGPESRLTISLEYNLAELLSQQGRFDEARAVAEPNFERTANAFGAGHYLTLLAKDNLAVALAGLGRSNQALTMHDEALAAMTDQLGTEHPYVLVVERNRMKTLQGFAPERIQTDTLEKLVLRHEDALGADHPDTLEARALQEKATP